MYSARSQTEEMMCPHLMKLLVACFHLALLLCPFENGLAGSLRSDEQEEEDDQEESRMWRGNRTSYKKHPYFIIIMTSHGLGSIGLWQLKCGGAFVTPQIVITAAHCLEDHQASELRVRYGSDEIGITTANCHECGKGIDYKVVGTFAYPKYDEFTNYRPDIGLLKLDVPIKHTSALLKLPEPGEEKQFVSKPFASTMVAIGSSVQGDPGLVMKEKNIENLTRGCLSDDWPHYSLCAMSYEWHSCSGTYIHFICHSIIPVR